MVLLPPNCPESGNTEVSRNIGHDRTAKKLSLPERTKADWPLIRGAVFLGIRAFQVGPGLPTNKTAVYTNADSFTDNGLGVSSRSFAMGIACSSDIWGKYALLKY